MLTRQVPFPQFFRTAPGMDEGCVRRQGNVIQLVDDQQEHSVELKLNTPDCGAEGQPNIKDKEGDRNHD
jgi:hypothetical protein